VLIRLAIAFGFASFGVGLGSLVSGGETHVVRLEANRFVPEVTRAHAGDTVKFVNGRGGPHNVEFPADSVPKAAHKLMAAAMAGGKSKLGPMSSPLLFDENEVYRFVVPPIGEGRYAFICLPHQAQMRGALVVTK
jgi:plastocyanin